MEDDPLYVEELYRIGNHFPKKTCQLKYSLKQKRTSSSGSFWVSVYSALTIGEM
jgi:hypothetical protein